MHCGLPTKMGIEQLLGNFHGKAAAHVIPLSFFKSFCRQAENTMPTLRRITQCTLVQTAYQNGDWAAAWQLPWQGCCPYDTVELLQQVLPDGRRHNAHLEIHEAMHSDYNHPPRFGLGSCLATAVQLSQQVLPDGRTHNVYFETHDIRHAGFEDSYQSGGWAAAWQLPWQDCCPGGAVELLQ